MRRGSQSANPSVQLSHCDRCPNRCISVAQSGKGVHSECFDDEEAIRNDSSPRTVRTRIPARLDRLPWSPWHWMVVVGLGTVWILDGLEVTIVGSMATRLSEPGSGIDITTSQVTGLGAAMYVAGACGGALFFGWLTDRFGRKKLFMLTLVLYLLATGLTALSFTAWWFFLFRFLTGFGPGGEYAAINSAIDELIPRKHRGRVDIAINGSFWLGAAFGALLSIPALNENIFPTAVGWRLTFALGVVFGLCILLVRRSVPESPRWLFIHGREKTGERLVDNIEQTVQDGTNSKLDDVDEEITVRQRKSIGFITIAKTVYTRYPRRTTLGLSLFIGQAFLQRHNLQLRVHSDDVFRSIRGQDRILLRDRCCLLTSSARWCWARFSTCSAASR